MGKKNKKECIQMSTKQSAFSTGKKTAFSSPEFVIYGKVPTYSPSIRTIFLLTYLKLSKASTKKNPGHVKTVRDSDGRLPLWHTCRGYLVRKLVFQRTLGNLQEDYFYLGLHLTDSRTFNDLVRPISELNVLEKKLCVHGKTTFHRVRSPDGSGKLLNKVFVVKFPKYWISTYTHISFVMLLLRMLVKDNTGTGPVDKYFGMPGMKAGDLYRSIENGMSLSLIKSFAHLKIILQVDAKKFDRRLKNIFKYIVKKGPSGKAVLQADASLVLGYMDHWIGLKCTINKETANRITYLRKDCVAFKRLLKK
jgi:hypothetical protein